MKKPHILFLIVLMAVFSSCVKDDDGTDSGPTSYKVKYFVTASPGGFNITYTNSSGGTEQKTVTSTKWETSFTGNSGDFVYLSAQADNANATITTIIYSDGYVFKKATSSGSYVIATASGSLP